MGHAQQLFLASPAAITLHRRPDPEGSKEANRHDLKLHLGVEDVAHGLGVIFEVVLSGARIVGPEPDDLDVFGDLGGAFFRANATFVSLPIATRS